MADAIPVSTPEKAPSKVVQKAQAADAGKDPKKAPAVSAEAVPGQDHPVHGTWDANSNCWHKAG